MTDAKPRILIIEDEPTLRRFVHLTLESQGYAVYESATGDEGLRLALEMTPDLVILDLGLPDVDGLEVTRRLREWTSLPIIVVSARAKEGDKIVALDTGADDYLTKPFGVKELLARVRVALRHAAAARQDTATTQFDFGDLRIDLARREVTVSARRVNLTRNEYELLAVLAKHAGKVLTHDQLAKEAWGPDCDDSRHYLRVYMNLLRRKLEDDPARPKYLFTEVGVGYRMRGD